MTAIDPQKAIQQKRTEQEMRMALMNLSNVQAIKHIPPQIDDDEVVIMDTIAELLELRQFREEVAGFVQVIQPKLSKR